MLQKKAFTLIELLIVISIIGILSTLAVSNYSSIRSSIENQFTVDTLIQETRQQSKLAENQSDPHCYSIYFQTKENQIQKFKTKFDPQTRVCQTRNNNSSNLLQNSKLQIQTILLDNQETTDFQLTFIPPQGAPLNPNKNQILQINLQPEDQPENKKTILINLQNGSIQEK